MLNKKLILKNAIRFGFVNELKKSKKNQTMIDYAVKLGFAIDQGDEAIFPWNKTGNPTYETWLLNQLKNPNHAQKGLVNFQEDGDKLERFISEFDRLKKQRQITGIDINQLDFSGVKKIVSDNENKLSRKSLERGDVDTKAKSGYEFRIFKNVSDAEEVAMIGQDTEWCTKELDTAKSHLSKGAIYIIFKHGNTYAQFHVETQQYMDVYDSPINSEMWQELRENIPFINQLVNRMGILKAMTADEIYSLIDSKGPHVEGSLNLFGTRITKLPDSLVSIGGDLDLEGTQIKKLPDSLKSVGGYLDLRGTQITKLPDSLKSVGGNLDLEGTKITKLPDSLVSVGGYLDLKRTPIKKLSNSLKIVNGNLSLIYCKEITTLPDSIERINGSLQMVGTKITKLPESLTYIGGSLKADYSKLVELNNKLETVMDSLNIHSTDVQKLPETLKHVGGDLVLYGTKIKKIPSSLKHVGGNLIDLRGTKIRIPKTLKYHGDVYR